MRGSGKIKTCVIAIVCLILGVGIGASLPLGRQVTKVRQQVDTGGAKWVEGYVITGLFNQRRRFGRWIAYDESGDKLWVAHYDKEGRKHGEFIYFQDVDDGWVARLYEHGAYQKSVQLSK